MSEIENQVIQNILKRAEIGKQKYATDMDRTDLSFLDWTNHLQEELLDAAIYLEKIKTIKP